MTTLCRFRFVLVVAFMLGVAAGQAYALTDDEVLAELPAKDSAHAAQIFEQVAAGDAALIVALCDAVRLWEEGADPKIPLALHGLANHVMRPEHTANRTKVARLYEAALNRAENPEIKRFFMNLLRVCGDGESLAALAPYLCDATLFDDAIYSVEAIGGDAALSLLENAACADMPEAFQTAVKTAVMRMRDTVAHDTDMTGLDSSVLAAASAAPAPDDQAWVAALCREALANQELKPHARALALRALANTDASAMLPDLLAAAKDPSPLVWGVALLLAKDMTGTEASRAWTRGLPEFPQSVQPHIIFMLGHRADTSSRSAVRAALAAEDLDMRLAACETIARHGGNRALPALERAMLKADSNTEIQAIKNAMLQLPEPDVSRRAARRAGSGDNTPQRVAYLEIITARQAEGHLRPVRQCLRDDEAVIRRAALNTLAVIGAQEDMPLLFEHLLTEADNAEVNAARAALVAVADRHNARPAALEDVRNRFMDADPESRARLLKTLDAFGDTDALEEARSIAEAALFGDLQDARDMALQTLGTWRHRNATDLLLGFFERLEGEELRMAVLKQVLISVPRTISDAPKQIEMLEKVEALCRTEAEKEAVAQARERVR